MKRVAHLIATNFYGGPERQIINQSVRMNISRLYEPMIISFEEDGKENELINKAAENGIRHALIHAKGAVNMMALYELYRILQRNSIKLLISHGYKANVIGRLVTLAAYIPMIAISRGWTAENRKIVLYEKLDKLFLKWATHIVAVSDGQHKKILKLYPNKKNISVIHNAIDIEMPLNQVSISIRQEFKIPDSALIVCTAGRLSPEKDQSTFIESARLINENRKDVYFLIFGEGPLRPFLENRIGENKLKSFFFLPGFRKDLLSITKQIDIFVLPSLTEGLPNVILEAYACKKPVVATSVGGTPEIVRHGENGFLFEPGDVNAMSNFIMELLDDKIKREVMGRQGYDYVEKFFNYSSQIGNYEKLFNRLINQNAT